MVLMGITLF